MKVKLVSMPFADLCRPSIALAQLKAVTRTEFGADITIDAHYISLEFARLLSPETYWMLAAHTTVYVSGFGEWLFRRAAFPDAPDNKEAYLKRYRHLLAPLAPVLETKLLPLRDKMDGLLDSLIERYSLHEADVVGFATMFSQNLASIAMARRLKARNPDQIVVFGGANCEGTMGIELVANVDVLDFAFSGHSLISFPRFLRCLLDGRQEDCHRINGVFTRRNCLPIGKVRPQDEDTDWGKLRPERQLLGITSTAPELDINTDIPLDYDDFFSAFEALLPGTRLNPVVPFETSRGCWWGERAHCTFCGLNGGTMAYRAMTPERALQLMQSLFSRYADRSSTFESCDNILPKEYFKEVFDKLDTPKHVALFYEVKANLKSDEVASLARARVLHIQPGIESLATSTLKLMRKGSTSFGNIQLLLDCLATGVTPSWNLLVGFPGETAEVYEWYRHVLPRLFHLPPPSDAFPVRFDRFSPYFTSSREYDLKLEPYEFYGLCYPFPTDSLMNMAYYFQDKNYTSRYLTDVAMWLGELRKIVMRWRQLWNEQQGKSRLSVVTEGRNTFVHDSRHGPAQRVPISTAELQALHALMKPTHEAEAKRRYGPTLELLDRKCLVFSERGRVMSLLPVEEPSATSMQDPSATSAGQGTLKTVA